MKNKKRLIDANALWKVLDEAGLFESGNPRHIAQQTVEEQPTVDAVEVVRCKDCKWRNTKGCPYMNFNAAAREDEDYCSDGERKDNEHSM